MWCTNANVCKASGGSVLDWEGQCYYDNGAQTRLLLNSATQVRSDEYTETHAKDTSMNNTNEFWQKTVNQFKIDVYESAEMSPVKLSDMLSKGVFFLNRQDSTVFLMFGERLRKIQQAVRNNVYFYADNMSDTTNIDHMLVGVQGFKTIVIVRDIQGVNLDGLFEALDDYPIRNEADLYRQCNYSDVQVDYRKLARMFLDKQRWWYFADFWWWIDKYAVDFSPTAMHEFEQEKEFLDAINPVDENLNLVQNMDLDIWRNKVCAAFAKKFNREKVDTRANDHGRQRTTMYEKIRETVEFRSDLEVDQTWMHGFDGMMYVIIDRQPEKKCLSVFGQPNEHCRFSTIKLWQVAQILMELDVMRYNKRTFKKCQDMLLVSGMLLTVLSVAFRLAKLCWCNITTRLDKALKPTEDKALNPRAVPAGDDDDSTADTPMQARLQSPRGKPKKKK